MNKEEEVTVVANDITGRNKCPIWKRITALMQAVPFQVDENADIVSPPCINS